MDDDSYSWVRSEGQKRLATANLVPKNRVYKERLVVKKGVEYRVWDPFRSKLAAAIMNGLEQFPFQNRSKVLYLGASTGTTVSHVSDIVGHGGLVFAVDHTSRVTRDFIDRVASHRKNIIPILQDARKPSEYFSMFGRVDVVYADIAQPDQTDIAVRNCQMYLKNNGLFFLIIKSRSINMPESPKKVILKETQKLRAEFDILESINLNPYHIDHQLVVARLNHPQT